MTSMNEFWQACVRQLEQELPPQQISAWIRPLVPLEFDEGLAVLRIAAPNRFKLDWVRKNFSSRIEPLASDWFSQAVQVSFELPAGTARGVAAPRPIVPNPAPNAPGQATPDPSAGPASAPATSAAVQSAAEDAVQDRSRLNV